jgi:abortive infection bacteriophage resistance protein
MLVAGGLRLSSYWYPLLALPKSAKLFKPNANFNQAFKLYCFDRELRRIILSELEKIEIAIRAKLINIMSLAYSPFWVEDVTLFDDLAEYTNTKAKLTQESNRSDEIFIKDFKRKHSNPLPPCWMLLEVASFGNISKLYSNLKKSPSKREIAHHFGLGVPIFESWLHSLAYIRNACAHHARIWNKKIMIQARIPQNPQKQWLTNGVTDNQKVYFVLL